MKINPSKMEISMSGPLNKIEFTLNNGQKKTLEDYQGKAVLIVNVASKCGLTPQYKNLELVYEKYQDKGLVVLGFPANEFLGQEPGTNEEIQAFCTGTFGIKFPIAQKIVVKGEGIHPLYKELISQWPSRTMNADASFKERLESHGLITGNPNDIMWNFEKFLISKKGEIIGRFAPDIEANSSIIEGAISKELGL